MGVVSVGLGPARIKNGTAEFEPVSGIVLNTAEKNLAAQIEDEINLPFTPDQIPLRFSLILEPDRYWLLVVYDHWLADSWSVRQLMHVLCAYYTGAENAPKLRTCQADFRSTFRNRLGFSPLLTSVTTAARQFFRHRLVWRLNLKDPLDFSAQILLRRFPDGLIQRLAKYAKTHGCTVNDLFLATAAAALGRHTLTRYDARQGRWPFFKSGVGIGTIVDIRARADRPLSEVFGLYLSFCTLVLKQPEARPFIEVLDEVARDTQRFKSRDEGVKFFCAINMTWMICRFYDKLRLHFSRGNSRFDRACSRSATRAQATFFHRNSHVIAGISNVNLTGSWMHPGQSGPASPLPVVDYLRISPTGPLSPVVFALTTIGPQMSLCFTWRKTALDQYQAVALAADFMKTLEGLVT